MDVQAFANANLFLICFCLFPSLEIEYLPIFLAGSISRPKDTQSRAMGHHDEIRFHCGYSTDSNPHVNPQSKIDENSLGTAFIVL